MAKQNMIQRELKRLSLVAKYSNRRIGILQKLKKSKRFNGNFCITKKFTNFTSK